MKLKGKFIFVALALILSVGMMSSLTADADSMQTESQVKVTSIKNEYKSFKSQKTAAEKLSALKSMNVEYKSYNKSDVNILNQYKKNIKAEKNYFIKKDKTSLKYLTLSKKDLNRSWSMLLKYKIKFLKAFRSKIKKEKNIVYTNNQYKKLNKKINTQINRYSKKLKTVKDDPKCAYLVQHFDNTGFYFLKVKTTVSGKTTYNASELTEHNGKITYHKETKPAGFTVD